MQITYIASFVPRKCGIATYTRDVALAVQKSHDVSVVAMENSTIPNTYWPPVTAIIHQDDREDYLEAAKKINTSTTDLVHLQHEFGLFGGNEGDYILELVSRLKKPLVVTFHTMLLTPNTQQKCIIQELGRRCRKWIVMDEVAKSCLEQVYGLKPSDSVFIEHGAPIGSMEQVGAKRAINFPDAYLMLANNLLSRNKGMEYAIQAVADIRQEIPKLIFLIVGETHPLVIRKEGESYREELKELVKKLHLEKQVIFINRYLSPEELQVYMAAADVYITPYLEPQQITSGTLAYAIGAGKACIATEYAYAKNMLKDGQGILVPMRESRAITQALSELYQNPQKRLDMEQKIKTVRQHMSWEEVARKHIECYESVLAQQPLTIPGLNPVLEAEPNLTHLMRMTDETGIWQHAQGAEPNPQFGYAIDDNARALIVVAQLINQCPIPSDTTLASTYLNFLTKAQDEEGKFHTFMDAQGLWLDAAAVTDAYGRAMWGLGYFIQANKDFRLNKRASEIWETSLNQVTKIQFPMTAVYTLLGLNYYTKAHGIGLKQSERVQQLLKTLADYLAKTYQQQKEPAWQWFAETITYDSFRFPQAMGAAYRVTGMGEYKDIARESMQFLTDCCWVPEGGYFDFIGQDGWYKRGGKKAVYDQQPLEAAAATEAYIFAAEIFEDQSYLEKAKLAFDWYLGRNRNKQEMYDRESGGVFDGLIPNGVNRDEGAESIICFLMAQLSLQKAMAE